jgi:hypothetical protein
VGWLSAHARLTRYANGEVLHFLRDRGFLIKVPPS